MKALGSELNVSYNQRCSPALPLPLSIGRENDSLLLYRERGETSEQIFERFFTQYGNAIYGIDPENDVLRGEVIGVRTGLHRGDYKQYYGNFYVAKSWIRVWFDRSGIQSIHAWLAPQVAPNTNDISQAISEEDAIAIFRSANEELMGTSSTTAELVIFDGRTIHYVSRDQPAPDCSSSRLAWQIAIPTYNQLFGYVDAIDGRILFSPSFPDSIEVIE